MSDDHRTDVFIDAHVHFYDLAHPRLRYQWLAPTASHPVIGDIDPLKSRRYLLPHFRGETRFTHVTGLVHIQAAIGSADPVEETRFVEAQRDDDLPMVLVGNAKLDDSGLDRLLEDHMAASPYFRGIRDFPAGRYLRDPAFQRGYLRLADHGLSYDLDATWPDFPDARALAQKASAVPLILGHAGFPQRRDPRYFDSWRTALRDLATVPNCWCKISGLGMVDQRWTLESLRPWVLECIDAFGPDRCMFATNWPVDRLFSGYGELVAAYRSIVADFSPTERFNLFSGTARRVYRIP